jgi:2-amino-4-hydroxy-6-hydroxymethyldihydropteridine diphosphokinase
MNHIAYLSVGSNIGDKIGNCRFGIRALCASGESRVLRQSGFYRTSPVDYEDQDWFVNAAVKIETKLSPRGLLKAVQEIQARGGRKPNIIRFGPRVLDLDIIFYDAVVMNTEGLKIPHPRMHKRRFVLQPICDIDPSIMHPILQKDMQALLNELKDSAQVIEEIQ